MDKSTEVSAIIGALGGTCAVAKLFDIKPPSVSGWIKDGEIPKARLMYLRLARPDVFESEEIAAPESQPVGAA